MTTIRDVARESRCSATTVSIVLNNAPLANYIPEETKSRIKQVAEELGYQPNLFARSLRSNRSHTIGVIVYDISDPYSTQVLRGIETRLYQIGYLPILADIQNSDSRFRNYLNILLQRRVEGLILFSNPSFIDVDKEFERVPEKRKVPTVLIGRESQFETFSSVVVNNEQGGRMAIEHLCSLGHRRIGFVKGPEVFLDSRQRWKGISTFAQEAGLEIDPELVVELRQPSASYEEGYQLTQNLLKRNRSFTALLAFDDMTAYGAIRALKTAGLEVPRDCSVIGFDDTSGAAFYNPPLTTVRQPMETLGTFSVEILVEAIQAALQRQSLPRVQRVVAPELIVRESTTKV
jgi:LacI family transcriptional regulator